MGLSTSVENKNARRAKRMGVILLILLTIAFIIYVIGGLDDQLETNYYSYQTAKANEDFRVVLLTDLHSSYYGEGQSKLIQAVENTNPDLLLWSGDIVDDEYSRLDPDNAYTALGELAKLYPSYYVSGNHEVWSRDLLNIKDEVEALGVTVLSGDILEIEVKNNKLILLGLDDPDSTKFGYEAYEKQLADIADFDQDKLSILLAHRPDRIHEYTELGVDIVLSGHAHGGQWRIPGLELGILAPNQGLFPKYSNGFYEEDDTTLLVSRGLARESTRIPRLYNSPEVVVLDILAASK